MSEHSYSAGDLLQCAARELSFREWVYPKRVAAGKMAPKAMEHELALMEAIVEHFAELAQKEKLL